MPHQERNAKGQNKQLLILLPITATLLVKNTSTKEPESKSLDFHLEMIKKIDKLLAKHEQEVFPAESFHTPSVNSPQPPTPVEPRPILNKAFPHQEIAWEPISESSRTMTPVIPEEFKTELSFNPEFRFITSREFIDTLSQIQPSSEDRVEIIDFHTHIKDDTAFHKTLNLTPIKNKILDEDHCHKKIEIIDTGIIKQKIPENLLNVSTEQGEQIDKKVRLYLQNTKAATEKKQQQLQTEQTDIPVDYEERSDEIKKKLAEEEKKLKQLEHEYEELEEIERKKTEFEKKKQEPREKEKNTQKKISPLTKSPQAIKIQEKEQKRLQRLEIRQQRIEERRRKKQEKQALKLKQKQQRLEMKGSIQQKTDKVDIPKEEKHASAPTFDEDLKKVLNMTDTLLSELPEDILNDFIESEDYKLYEKVMNKYKIR